MAIKFNDEKYWSPSRWVSRALFLKILELKIPPSYSIEQEISNEIKRAIELETWLLDFQHYNVDKLIAFKRLITEALLLINIPDEFKNGWHKKSTEVIQLLNNEIKLKY